MANDVGYIRPGELQVLKNWLDRQGIGWNPGIGLWEAIRIAYGAHNCVVTRNKQDVYKTPVELRPLLLKFRDHMATAGDNPDEITDSERLEFLLRKGRQVVVEIEGWGSEGRHYAVYVTEGTFDDVKYPAVRFSQEEDFSGVSEEGFKVKREAINLAIIESRSKTSEESN